MVEKKMMLVYCVSVYENSSKDQAAHEVGIA